MKLLFLFLYVINLYSFELNDSIEISKKFLNLENSPLIIEKKEYNSKEYSINLENKNGIIQGSYLSNKNLIYLYSLNEQVFKTPDNSNSCKIIQNFIKTGFLVHELTHYKQYQIDKINLELSNEPYFNNILEEEAFENQIKFWDTYFLSVEKDWNLCFKNNKKFNEWYNSYIYNSQTIHSFFVKKCVNEKKL